MPENRGIEVHIAVAIHERLATDRAAGGIQPLADYLGLYPGHEITVAREYLDVAEASGDAGVDPGPAPAGAGPASTRIGPYRLIDEVGRGGQGTVYRAEDVRLGRTVALKVLAGAGDPGGQKFLRFRREAEVASRLDHAGICSVHETGLDGGVAWIAMQWIEGESLARRIASARGAAPGAGPETRTDRGSPPENGPDAGPATRPTPAPGSRDGVRTIIAWFAEAARALHAAHEAGIVHRDIKPANLMVATAPTARGPDAARGTGYRADDPIRPGERPVILDFGLARDESSDGAGLTATGDVFGTPAYMAPEQIRPRGGPADARTDVHGLGVALFESLTLARPFEAPTREALYREILERDPDDVRRRNPAVSRDLATVVATALAKERDRRYRSAEALAEDLEAVLALRPVAARPTGPFGRTLRWARREPFRAAVVLLLALGLPLLGGLGAYVLATRGEVRAAEAANAHRQIEALLEHGYLLVHSFGRGDPFPSFEAVLARDPGNVEALAGMALAHRRAGDRERALDLLEGHPDTCARSPGLRRLRAVWARALGRPEAGGVPNLDPAALASAVDWFVAGEERLAAAFASEPGAAREALGLFQGAMVRSRQARPLMHFHATAAAALAADRETASLMVGALRTLWPGSAVARCWAGFALFHGGDAPGALAEYEEARRLDPALGLAWHGRANALLKMRDAAGALAAFREAFARDRTLVAAEVGAGESLVTLGRPAEALDLAGDLARDHPGHVEPLLLLGGALTALGRPAEAVEPLERAARARPALAVAHSRLAVALAAAGRIVEAESAFRRALAADPYFSDAVGGLAMVLTRKGDFAAARVLLEDAVGHGPPDALLLYDLGVVLCELGKPADALPRLRESVRLDPDHPMARVMLGRALETSGEEEAGIVSYRETIARFPECAEAWCNLGQALRRQGSFREAVPCLARGHELGSRRSDWSFDTASWLESARKLVLLLDGRDEALRSPAAAGPRPWGDYALVSAREGRPDLELSCLERSLAADPPPAGAAASEIRLRAARAGIAAAATQPAPLDGSPAVADPPSLRSRALALFRADLAEIASGLSRNRLRSEAAVRAIESWTLDPGLGSVRAAALEALPEAERSAWRAAWSEAQAILDRIE